MIPFLRIGNNWLSAIVVSILEEVNYKVLLFDGRIYHRHVDHMVKRHLHKNEDENEEIPVVEAVGSGLPLKGTGALVSRVMFSGYHVGTRDEMADVVESWSGPARIVGSSPTVRADPVPVVRPSLSSVPVASSSVYSDPVATEPRKSTRECHPPSKLKDCLKS